MIWKGWKAAPLPASFMLTALLGLAVSGVWVLPRSSDWGVAFLVFFTVTFVAALVSMTYAPIPMKRRGV